MQRQLPNPVEVLRHQFNHNQGALRLVIFLSPSRQNSLNCLAEIQKSFQAQYQYAELFIYVIWQPVFPSDHSQKSKVLNTSKQNLIEFWDEQKIIGQWFAQQVVGFTGLIWDMFFLYEPTAHWSETPCHLITSAGNLAQHHISLEQTLRLWLHHTSVSLPQPLLIHN